LLSGSKLGGIFASSKIRLALVLCLAGSIPATITYAYQGQQIADKTAIIDEQSRQILNYESLIASQEQELESKAALLESMNLQISVLQDEIAANEQAIAKKTAEAASLSATVDSQRAQLQSLQSQALQLQNEINSLSAQLSESQDAITDLERQMQSTQAQLDSAKRIKVSHYGLGVTEDGEGVVFPIEVEIIGSGDGTISVDVKDVQYEASFQDAVRTAARVASDYSDMSVSDKDIIIRFVNNDGGLIRVDGGSAGALITGMIIAGLTDREVNPSVLLTGTIQSDGTVGDIGGLESKTDAAAEFGAETMLVPKDQQFWHPSIRVVGVSDIDEVMRYLAPN
jgi:ATP-dependent Lon protease